MKGISIFVTKKRGKKALQEYEEKKKFMKKHGMWDTDGIVFMKD